MNNSLINNISVIVPVYNAEQFIHKAVESALMQPEVAEVLLIEDGSEDNSLAECRSLATKYKKVKLFTHENNINKGAGISRNVGIKNATTDYIAFLDADDFFLPDRFRAERKIFIEKPETDGVYGALGFHYYSDRSREKYKSKGFTELTTVSEKVPSEELFLVLLGLHKSISGYFSIDTLTIKRSVFFGKTELFGNLVLHQDTAFLFQLSLNCILESGVIEVPIGLRGAHDNNRIVDRTNIPDSRLLMWSYLHDWSVKAKDKHVRKIFEAFMIEEKIRLSKRLLSFYLFTSRSLINKYFLLDEKFFNLSCVRVFGKRIARIVIFARKIFVMKLLGEDKVTTRYADLIQSK